MKVFLLKCVAILTSMTIACLIFSPDILSTKSAHAAATQPQVLYSGNNSLPEVALTFDDGPSPLYGPEIQEELEKYHAAATFFYVGEMVNDYPMIVLQAEQAGFAIGNHTWDHSALTDLSPDAVHSQLNRTNKAIKNAIEGKPVLMANCKPAVQASCKVEKIKNSPRQQTQQKSKTPYISFMRPPYGAVNSSVTSEAAESGMSTVMWDIDTDDWMLPGVDAIVHTVESQVHNGAIILMHEGGGDRSQTVTALKQIIPNLQQRGYRFVTIPEMLAGH